MNEMNDLNEMNQNDSEIIRGMKRECSIVSQKEGKHNKRSNFWFITLIYRRILA